MSAGLARINRVLMGMLAGILLYGVVGELVIAVFLSRRLYGSIGWWIGVVMAMAAAAHMYWSLDMALDLGRKDATQKLIFHNLLRYGVLVIVAGAVMVTDIGNPLALVFGLFGLKAGAYLQPVLDRLYQKMKKEAAS